MQPLSYGPHRIVCLMVRSQSPPPVEKLKVLRGEAVWAQELGDRAPCGALREVYPVQMAAQSGLGAQQPCRAPGEPLGLKEGEGIAGTWWDLLLGILAEGEGAQACKAEALQSGQSR